jgi:hypothetical protein
MHAMTEAIYRSPASALRVRLEEAPVFEWLSEFFAPWLDAASDIAPGAPDVRLVIDPGAFDALKAQGPRGSSELVDCFRLDQGLVRLPLWAGATGDATVFDEPLGAFYARRGLGEAIDVIVAVDSSKARVAMMRVVRELTMSRLVAAGWLIVHSSAFVVDGRAILVVGPKRAGKTTLLTYALTSGLARCLANDRVAVALGGGHTAWGVPTIISLRVAMMRRFPILAHRLQTGRYDFRFSERELRAAHRADVDLAPPEAWSVTPAQYCDLVESSLIGGSVPVAAVLFPRLMDDGTSIDLEPIDPSEAAARLAGSLFRPHGREALFVRRGEVAPSEAALRAAAKTFIGGVGVHACRIGADAANEGAWIKAVAG